MKNDFKHSDKHLQKKFEDFRMAAPEGAWTGIESQITHNSKDRGGFFYLWLTLLIISLTGGALSTYFYFNTSDSDINANSKTTLSKNTSHNTPITTVQSPETNHASDPKINSDHNTTHNSEKETTASNTAVDNENPTPSKRTLFSGKKTARSAGNDKRTGDNSYDSKTTGRMASKNAIKDGTDSDDGERKTPDPTTVASNSTDSENHKDVSGSKDPIATETANKSLTELELSNLKLRGYGPINSELQKTPKDFDGNFKAKGIWSLETGFDIASFNYNHVVPGDTQNLESFLNNSYTRSASQGGYLRANYQPFKYTSFHAGLEFNRSRASQEYTNVTSTTFLQFDTVGYYFDTVSQQQIPILDSSYVTTENKELIPYNSTISQVAIPIGVMFHIPVGLRSEIGVNLSGLMTFRTGSNGDVLIDQNGNSIVTSEAFRSLNFSTRGTIRYSYLLNERATVYAEPYFGIGLNDRSNTSLPFTSRFRNSGVRVGFRYSF